MAQHTFSLPMYHPLSSAEFIYFMFGMRSEQHRKLYALRAIHEREKCMKCVTKTNAKLCTVCCIITTRSYVGKCSSTDGMRT